MNDVVVVQVGQARTHLPSVGLQNVFREAHRISHLILLERILGDLCQQVAAFVKFHDQIEVVFILVMGQQSDNIGMLQLSCLLQFPLKHSWIGLGQTDGLNGTALSILLGASLVDRSKATLPELGFKNEVHVDIAFHGGH
eukprot:Skav232723  [mRNA]  locus=scaffold3777:57007:67306:- [translate_table: standard]